MRSISLPPPRACRRSRAQQDGRRVEVVAGVDEVLDRRRHALVHQLQARRDDAGRDHGCHRLARGLDVGKLAMMQRASCGFGTSLTVTSVTTASMPSLPTTSGNRSSPGASSAAEPKLTGSPRP